MTSDFPAGRPYFSLLEDTVVSDGPHRLTVRGRWGDIDVADDCPMVREALHRMCLGPVSLENIPVLRAEYQEWRATGICGTEWPRMRTALDQLGGCVVHSLGLHDGAGPILSLVAVLRDAEFRWPKITDDEPVSTPATARIEVTDGQDTLTGAAQPYVAVLHRPPAGRVARLLLDGTTTITDIARRLRVRPEVVADIVAYLASGGYIRTRG